ncbi:MAG TPA: response regulator transcription factor [Candidatus Acidoferrum sp.]|nr:response regulator transcription factor [Candidatus Acidoferrum sp.]
MKFIIMAMRDVTGEPPAVLAQSSEDAPRPAPRVVLADDHPELLAETQSLLEPDFEVVCLATGGAALLRAVLEAKPDGVVSDVQMPGVNGIEAGSEIVRQGLCGAVVMLSMYNDPQLLSTALEAGIRGYVLKEDAGEELIPALRAVLAGNKYFSRGVRSALPD